MEINEHFLAEWAQTLGQWLLQGKTVYAFCHCPFEKYSPDTCAELYRRVKAVAQLGEDKPSPLHLVRAAGNGT